MYKAVLVLFCCCTEPLLASAHPDEEGNFATFETARGAYEVTPGEDTFGMAHACGLELVDALTGQAKESQRHLLDAMWEDRGDRGALDEPDEEGVSWEACEENVLNSHEDQARFFMALGRAEMTDLQMALTQRYGPFEGACAQDLWERSKKQFACDAGAEGDLEHVGARRVDMLLGEAVCAFFRPRIAQIEARLQDLVPVWLWQQVSAFEEIPGVSQFFWMNFCRLPLGSRNFLWLLDRPEVSEDFLSIQKATMAKAHEEGEADYNERWAVPSFLALLQMPHEAYQQDMQALKAFIAARDKDGMPLVDVTDLTQVCARTRFALLAFERLSAFVWCADKVRIKSQSTTPLSLHHTSWSPEDVPVPSWLSYKLISAMTQMQDLWLSAFMGHLETAGHSYLEWVWTDPQSADEQTASDISESEEEEPDTDDAAPAAA